MTSSNVKKILMGFSGGIDSTVAAFLLKNQGYEVHNVCFQFLDSQDEEDLGEDFNTSCHIEHLDKVKAISESLGIPFYAVNAKSQFNSEILDRAVSNRLFGKSLSTCLLCNKLKIEILHEKAKKLKCDAIATGHYAKIHKNTDGSKINIFSSNDKENDQARILARVNQEFLKDLILPLSDLRKKEVREIANRYKLNYLDKETRPINCFIENPSFSKFIKNKSSESLRPTATFYNSKTGTHLGDNDGIFNYFLGQTKLKTVSKAYPIDKKLAVVRLNQEENEVVLGEKKRLVKSGVRLSKLSFSKEFDQSRPGSIYIPLLTLDEDAKRLGKGTSRNDESEEGTQEYVKGEILLKNNNNGLILFEKRVYNLVPGSSLSLFVKTGTALKLVGAGTIEDFDDLHLNDATSILSKKEEKNRDAEQEIIDQSPNVIELDLDLENNDPSPEESNGFGF